MREVVHTGQTADPDHRHRRVVFAARAPPRSGSGLSDNAGDNALWAILGGVLLAFIGTALLTPLVARPVVGRDRPAVRLVGAGQAGPAQRRAQPAPHRDHRRRADGRHRADHRGQHGAHVGQDEHHEGGRRTGPRRPDHLRRSGHGRTVADVRPGGDRQGVPARRRPDGDRPLRGPRDRQRRPHGRSARSPTSRWWPGMFSLTAAAGDITQLGDRQAIVDAELRPRPQPDRRQPARRSSWPGRRAAAAHAERHLRQERSHQRVHAADLGWCRTSRWPSRRWGSSRCSRAPRCRRSSPRWTVCWPTARRSPSATATTT